MIYFVLNKFSGAYSEKLEEEILLTSKSIIPNVKANVIYTALFSKIDEFNQYHPDIKSESISDGDIIVAVGGDGTVNICLNFIHLNKLQDRVKLAIIPMGTGNNMLKTLNLSKRIYTSIKIIKNNKTEKLQYGLINDKYTFLI